MPLADIDTEPEAALGCRERTATCFEIVAAAHKPPKPGQKLAAIRQAIDILLA